MKIISSNKDLGLIPASNSGVLGMGRVVGTRHPRTCCLKKAKVIMNQDFLHTLFTCLLCLSHDNHSSRNEMLFPFLLGPISGIH